MKTRRVKPNEYMTVALVGLLALACASDLGCYQSLAQQESDFQSFQDQIKRGQSVKRADMQGANLSEHQLEQLLDLQAEKNPEPGRSSSPSVSWNPSVPLESWESNSPLNSEGSTAFPVATNVVIVVGLLGLSGLLLANNLHNRRKGLFFEPLVNRVARFKCNKCGSPICLPAAWRSVIQAVPRSDPRFDQLDRSKMTEHQLNTTAPVWILVECGRCSETNYFDEVGGQSLPPTFEDDSDKNGNSLDRSSVRESSRQD